MSYLTNQQIFDKVSTHLLKQKKKAVVRGACRYRYRGLKCGIGCLIPNDKYKPSLEGKGVTPFSHDIGYAVLDALKGIIRKTRGTLELLNELQDTHDEFPPRQWKERLRGVAKNYRLKVNFQPDGA